jgi:hypothetical protein
MANMKMILVVGLVVVILAYISVLHLGSNLDIDNFADLGQKANTFTLYYMNGCPHCETILPEYKKFASAGQVRTNGKITKIRMLEQGDPNAGAEIEANKIKGFPTFILNTASGKKMEYQGDRTVDGISKFITQNAS